MTEPPRSPRPGVIEARALVATLFAVAAIAGSPRASASPPQCGSRTFSVYFEQFKATLNVDARDALTATQKSFAGCRIAHARVIGLAGALGNPKDNQLLSEQRTHVIAEFLVAGGWPRSALELVALGDRGAKVGDQDKPIRRRVRIEVQSRPAR